MRDCRRKHFEQPLRFVDLFGCARGLLHSKVAQDKQTRKPSRNMCQMLYLLSFFPQIVREKTIDKTFCCTFFKIKIFNDFDEFNQMLIAHFCSSAPKAKPNGNVERRTAALMNSPDFMKNKFRSSFFSLHTGLDARGTPLDKKA